MVRKQPSKKSSRQIIRWRSHEPSRLETFSDAVFAFAVTLIIVSLEVPKTFNELFETMKGFVAFAACFFILFQVWSGQNNFFRRYGLTDGYTTSLNGILLFFILVYTYPLKFLFVLLFSDGTFNDHGQTVQMITVGQVPRLMYIYHIGYIIIYLLFYLMYRNAKSRAHELELTPVEIYETVSSKDINLINVGVGLVAILATLILPERLKGTSGMIYFLLPFTYSLWFSFRGRKRRRLYGEVTERFSS